MSLLRTRAEGPVLIITLNRPEKRNALNDEIVLELGALFADLGSEFKAAVLTGEGEHFSAGLDLAELTERDAMAGVQHSRMWHRTLDQLSYGPVPIVAALHGAVVGGGLELAAATHIRVADRSTFYALPEGRRGIYVGGGASVRVPRLVGVPTMTDMMLTGRVIDAEAGYLRGFSQYLVDQGAALDEAIRLAHLAAENAPMTNLAVTQVLPRIASASEDQGLMMESLMAAMAQDAPVAKQRLRDFLEGRAKKVGQE